MIKAKPIFKRKTYVLKPHAAILNANGNDPVWIIYMGYIRFRAWKSRLNKIKTNNLKTVVLRTKNHTTRSKCLSHI